jgi:ElaB/YqjD/DUF883 family membrane-anchored ribosome-binding protein
LSARKRAARSLSTLDIPSRSDEDEVIMEQNHQNGKADTSEISDSQAAGSTARDKLMDDLKSVIGDAENWLKDAAGQGAEASSDIRARFEDTLRTARSDLRKLEDSLLAQGRSAADSANVYVHDNPWKSVGLGTAVGVIVGLLIARR